MATEKNFSKLRLRLQLLLLLLLVLGLFSSVVVLAAPSRSYSPLSAFSGLLSRWQQEHQGQQQEQQEQQQQQQQSLQEANLHSSSISQPPLPVWPSSWMVNWTMYNVASETILPPYLGEPPAPYQAVRGTTYYDFNAGNMLEVYYDECVNIFPHGNNWTCRFLITNSTSYLLADNALPWFPPCCVFEQPFYPPSPTFANVMTYNGTTEFGDGQVDVDWWILLGPPPETFTGFGYGFFDNYTQVAEPKQFAVKTTATKAKSAYATPAAFYFEGEVGWVQQNFHFFTPTSVDPSIFDLPSYCVGSPSCNFD